MIFSFGASFKEEIDNLNIRISLFSVKTLQISNEFYKKNKNYLCIEENFFKKEEIKKNLKEQIHCIAKENNELKEEINKLRHENRNLKGGYEQYQNNIKSQQEIKSSTSTLDNEKKETGANFCFIKNFTTNIETI